MEYQNTSLCHFMAKNTPHHTNICYYACSDFPSCKLKVIYQLITVSTTKICVKPGLVYKGEKKMDMFCFSLPLIKPDH